MKFVIPTEGRNLLFDGGGHSARAEQNRFLTGRSRIRNDKIFKLVPIHPTPVADSRPDARSNVRASRSPITPGI
jgi:hypothetical protein